MLKAVGIVLSIVSTTSALAQWTPPGTVVDPDAIKKVPMCNPANNPYLAVYEAAQQDIATKIEAILTKYGLTEKQSCTDLPETKSTLCSDEIKSLVINERVQAKIAEIAAQAKADLMSYVRGRYALFHDDLGRQLTLARMLKRLELAQFTVFQVISTQAIVDEVNWFLETVGAMDAPVVALNLSSIMLVDSAPAALYWIFLHEMGHFIDPDNFRFDDDYSQNPFSEEIMCLKRSDSVGSKENDFACLRDAGVDSDVIKYFKKNPDGVPNHGYACQKSQLNEAFSDWLAAEVIGTQMISMTRAKARDFGLQASVFFCHSLADLNRGWPDLNPEQKQHLLLEEHPMTEDRLNRIFLAHPLIRYRLGYYPGEYNTLKGLGAPKSDAVVYCGPKLYQ